MSESVLYLLYLLTYCIFSHPTHQLDEKVRKCVGGVQMYIGWQKVLCIPLRGIVCIFSHPTHKFSHPAYSHTLHTCCIFSHPTRIPSHPTHLRVQGLLQGTLGSEVCVVARKNQNFSSQYTVKLIRSHPGVPQRKIPITEQTLEAVRQGEALHEHLRYEPTLWLSFPPSLSLSLALCLSVCLCVRALSLCLSLYGNKR